MEPYKITITISTLLIFIGIVTYFRIFFKSQTLQGEKSLKQIIVDLISHVSEPQAGPGPHIIAGVSLACGVSLLIASILSDFSAIPEKYISYVVSISSLIVGALFSSISMWTLWQTRRLDYQVGFKIHDFYHLIKHLNGELENLLYSLQTNYQMEPQSFHRVYLVTTQPFLGMLSYSTAPEAKRFKSLINDCAQAYTETIYKVNRGEITKPFEFQVICGDKSLIASFHKKFYAKKDATEQKIKDINDVVESQLKFFNDAATTANKLNKVKQPVGPFHRLTHIPKGQYMIIGNTLFEFTLDPGNSYTEIFNTQVVNDSRYCEAYKETFKAYLLYR